LDKSDAQFKVVFDAIRQLMTPPEPKRRPIGFRVADKGDTKQTEMKEVDNAL
jgi:hypothetical protein